MADTKTDQPLMQAQMALTVSNKDDGEYLRTYSPERLSNAMTMPQWLDWFDTEAALLRRKFHDHLTAAHVRRVDDKKQ